MFDIVLFTFVTTLIVIGSLSSACILAAQLDVWWLGVWTFPIWNLLSWLMIGQADKIVEQYNHFQAYYVIRMILYILSLSTIMITEECLDQTSTICIHGYDHLGVVNIFGNVLGWISVLVLMCWPRPKFKKAATATAPAPPPASLIELDTIKVVENKN